MQLAIYSGGAEEDFNILQFVQCQTVYNNSFDMVSEQADWGKTKETVPKLASFRPVWVSEKELIVDNITNYLRWPCLSPSKQVTFLSWVPQAESNHKTDQLFFKCTFFWLLIIQ